MALFSSIFYVNDERATAHLNFAQPITTFNKPFLFAQGVAEGDPITISTGMGCSAFSCSLLVHTEEQDVDVVLGSDWFSLYSAATWSSERHSTDQPVLSDHAMSTGRHLSFFFSH